MAFSVGQGIYGERDRGHRLLDASGSFLDADKLAGRMDLQGSPPPHTEWQSYLSGFLWNDHYILARTTPDRLGTRENMVFSRAFSMPADQAGMLDDIGGLLELLESLGDVRNAAKDVAWRAAARVPGPSYPLVHALLSEGADPVVWASSDGFAQALASLWRSLWPGARLALSFRIAFSPADIAASPPTIVTTPAALLTRWSGSRIAGLEGSGPAAATPAELYLMGERTDQGVAALVDAFGHRMAAIGDLQRIIEIDRLSDGSGAFDAYVDALRLACHFAPEARRGDKIKTRLIDGAVKTMPAAGAADILMARNLGLESARAGAAFWTALSDWAKTGLWKDAGSTALLKVIDESGSPKVASTWRAAVAKGIRAALGRPTRAMAAKWWTLLESRPALLTDFVKRLGAGHAFENALVDCTPGALAADVGDVLARQAAELNLMQLHAASCAAGLPPLDAIRRHLGEASFDARSVARAAAKAKGADLVAAAIEIDNDELLDLAAQAAADAPSVLRKLDIAEPRWRALWASAIVRDPVAAAGPRDAQTLVYRFFNETIDCTISDSTLLDALSATPFADLFHYAQREKLLAMMPPNAAGRYLCATADGWLAAFEGGDHIACDGRLAEEILRPQRLDPLLARLAATPASGFALFRTLHQIEEARFGRWLDEALRQNAQFTADDANTLGRLLAARNWSATAGTVVDAIIQRNRDDLRPALDYIIEWIGFFQRLFLNEWGSVTPSAAKWRILEELLIDLYGYGPRDGGIWQRAGGKPSDMPKADTGAEAWRRVVADAEKGRGIINVSKLIAVMAAEYPGNAALQKLRGDALFERRS